MSGCIKRQERGVVGFRVALAVKAVLVRVDRAFVFAFDFVAVSPLPVVVAVIVDFFDGYRCFCGDSFGEIFVLVSVWFLDVGVLLVVFFTGFFLFFLFLFSLVFFGVGEFVGVLADVSKASWGLFLEGFVDVFRDVGWWCGECGVVCGHT